ncbi:MAG: hypothetical protein IJ264_06720, partial [Clostridia bacterium]|nr:hypothetical protein [Clostridia bacterium]
GDKQLAGNSGGMMNGHGKRPDGMTTPEKPEGEMPPEGFEPPDGFTHPNGEVPPEMPEGNRPEKPFGERPDMPNGNNAPQESFPDFVIKDGGNMFGNIVLKNK